MRLALAAENWCYPMKVAPETYSALAVEATKALLSVIDPTEIAKAGWELFIKDVFDLTDALATELAVRLERNAKESE